MDLTEQSPTFSHNQTRQSRPVCANLQKWLGSLNLANKDHQEVFQSYSPGEHSSTIQPLVIVTMPTRQKGLGTSLVGVTRASAVQPESSRKSIPKVDSHALLAIGICFANPFQNHDLYDWCEIQLQLGTSPASVGKNKISLSFPVGMVISTATCWEAQGLCQVPQSSSLKYPTSINKVKALSIKVSSPL